MTETKCPKCETALSADMVSTLKDKTRVVFEITQEPGYRLSAGTLGGILANNEKLLAALAKQYGTTLTVLVENIYMKDDKTVIEFQLTVPKRKSKERRGK